MVEVSEVAKRVASLVPTNAREEGLVNFVVGAIHSVAWCKTLGMKPTEPKRPDAGTQHVEEVKRVAHVIAIGKPPPTNSPWLPLYFFNNALIRVDVCFERVAQNLVGRKIPQGFDAIKNRIKEKRSDFPLRYLARWEKIRIEVNNMKHKSPKLLQSRRVKLRLLLNGINDLLSAIEWLFAHKA